MKIDELEIENDFFRFDSSFYELVKATPLKEPKLISFSKRVCDLIGLDYSECEKKEFIDFLNGKKLLKNSTPYATVYAGHQFGHFVPQLGDTSYKFGSFKWLSSSNKRFWSYKILKTMRWTSCFKVKY